MKLFLFFKPNYPFAPCKVPFFYGWLIVIFTTVGTVASIPGQTMGVGVFSEYLISKTGLNRIELSLTYMLGTILSSLILPFAGKDATEAFDMLHQRDILEKYGKTIQKKKDY